MKTLEDIAIEQIGIERGRLLDSYRQDIEAMKRLHAAQGKLKSGATIKATIESSKNLYRQFRDLSISKVKIAIDDSIIFPEASVQKLKGAIESMSSQMHGNIYAIMADICKLAGKPELCERLMPEIMTEKEETLSEIYLQIDSGVISKRNKGVKGIVKSLFGWVSKAFGSPAS